MSGIVFTITAIWDEEAEVWSGSCDEVPVAADAPTREELLARIREIAVDPGRQSTRYRPQPNRVRNCDLKRRRPVWLVVLLAVFPVDRVIDWRGIGEAIRDPLHDHPERIVTLDEVGRRATVVMGRGHAHAAQIAPNSLPEFEGAYGA
jgi:hypothetical protein